MAGAFQVRFSRYAPQCASGLHRHAEARIVLPVWRSMESRYGRRMIPLQPGQALYRPAGEDHVDAYDAPMDCVSLLLPTRESVRVLREPLVIGDPDLAGAAMALRVEAEIGDAASPLVSEGLATLIASIVLNRAPVAARGRPHWIGRVRDRLEDADAEAPTLAELAREAGRAPAHVAATFKAVYGVSAGQYLRRLRLWRVRREIESGACGLAEAAQRHGFSDQSHLTRQFRDLFGVAPGAYARRHGAGQVVRDPQA
jgi:AraC-like DNA-binding protein